MQGSAYVLAIGWLGAGTRRGTGRRSGGDRKRTAGRSAGWRAEGGTGGTGGRLIAEEDVQIIFRIYRAYL